MAIVWMLVTVVVPGALVALALPRGLHRWVALTAAPAVTYGMVTFCSAWLRIAQLPDSPLVVLVAEVVLGVCFALGGQSWRVARVRGGVTADPEPDVAKRKTFALTAGALASATPPTVFGWLLLRGLASTPGWDAANHGFMVRRMMQAGHTDVATACVTGALAPKQACGYYPLAADVTWAQAALLGDGRVSPVMNVTAWLVAPLFLALGTFALTRWLGAGTLVATAAGTAVGFVGPLWPALYLGRVNEQASAALSPATALMVVLALRSRSRVVFGVLAGLASAGILAAHTYQAIFVAVLAVAIVATTRQSRFGPERSQEHLFAGVVSGVLTIALAMGPSVRAMSRVTSEVGHYPAAFPGDLSTAIRFYVLELARYSPLGVPAPSSIASLPEDLVTLRVFATIVALGLAVGVGSCLHPRMRWARPWAAAWALMTGLGVWTSTSPWAALHIGSLWYGTLERLRVMMLPVYGVLAVAGWCAVGLLVAWLARAALRAAGAEARGRRWATTSVLSGALALAMTGALVTYAFTPTERQPVRDLFLRRSAVGPEYARVFTWLQANTRPGASVAWDANIDFMSWAYGDYGVASLYGLHPLTGPGVPDDRARQRALAFVADMPTADPAAGCEVRAYNVQFLAVGPPSLRSSIFAPTIDRKHLASTPRLTLVHRDGEVSVYAVTAAGRQCSR